MEWAVERLGTFLETGRAHTMVYAQPLIDRAAEKADVAYTIAHTEVRVAAFAAAEQLRPHVDEATKFAEAKAGEAYIALDGEKHVATVKGWMGVSW